MIKKLNECSLIENYNDEFIDSISLKNIKSRKDLRNLLNRLELANDVVTNYYEMLYNDFIIYINSDSTNSCKISVETINKYKKLADKIHKAYNYILYISTFENPFKNMK
jgi:hypothetical protein